MQEKGHEIFFTCREKEFETYLLKKYGFLYESFGRKYSSKIGKLIGLFEFDIKEIKTSIRFRPDILISHGSMYTAHTAFLLGKPHISLEDSGNMEQIRLYKPFTKVILTPDVLVEDLGGKQIKYNSYHELAYLHPNYFKPNDSIFKLLKISVNEEYCILRFVSWQATHDSGQKGFTLEDKLALVKLMSAKMKVFISSESKLSNELEAYQIHIPPEKIHDALYHASIVVSEGATIASEAGVLGTTSVYVNTLRRSYCEDQERFGLVYSFQDPQKAFSKIESLISDERKMKKQYKSLQMLLKEKVDLTAFLMWFIENWPQSYTVMNENPDYHLRFK